ncbi:nuclear transport factor 2 family protein [Solwaraspora sp. WMMD406]|uniref:nuclear transport factor 2 family protein n=1 Tax=Solwaraspora sp. WMMD406 TaxID=3016095 RepID=UPI002416DD54|nr:nuclear transport factor 2 family protein [Solwaraspora sp. WMMD406]MDG4766006.1 nuclear transport factor 2 family protein [Solwaraspora sp. WMMD406]
MDMKQHHGTAVSWDELPAAIAAYLPAHQAHDAETAIRAFAANAEVTDEGRTYRGLDEIRTWLLNGGSEYTYTTDFVSAHRIGDTHVDVVQHLEGNFPGGSADLHYRFDLDGAVITRLVIAP